MIFEDADQKNENSIRQQLEDVFLRDWSSPYAEYSNSSCWNLRASSNSSRIQYVPPLYN